MPLDLGDHRFVSGIERLFKRFGNLLYKKVVLRRMNAYFSYFVFNVVRRIIQFQKYIYRCYSFKKAADLSQFTLNVLNKALVRVEMYGLDIHIHMIVYW